MKSEWYDETQVKRYAMLLRTSSISSRGARATTVSSTSWFCRCTSTLSTGSTSQEHPTHRPIWPAQQELLDVKLAAGVGQVGERHLAMRRVEDERISDLHSTAIRAEAG